MPFLFLAIGALAVYILTRPGAPLSNIAGTAVNGVAPGTVIPGSRAMPVIPGSSGGVSPGQGIGLGTTGATVGLQGAAGLGLVGATSAIPVVGAIGAVAGAIVSTIKAHHNAAVQHEAADLNTATPYVMG